MAWKQVVGAFLLTFNSYVKGPFLSFGPLTISTFTGPLFDLGYMRGLLSTGTALIFLVRDYFGIFLSLSILLGLGSGSTGIAATGGAFGGVVIPIIFKASLTSFKVGWAYKTLTFIALITLFISFFMLRTRSAFSDLKFMFFSLSLFFSFAGLYIPFYYVPLYVTADLNVTASLTFGILSIINTGALFKRSFLSLTTKYFSSINILTILIFGAIVSLLINVRTRFSLSYSFVSFGILIRSLIAGILISRFGYRALQIFKGIFIMLRFMSVYTAALIYRASRA
ncbi:MFS monocarboxylate transporter-like protein [Diplogelasinospora grovesii]|uniref:MFS monocarboxylate transporter-like protein n=1 Tax=Diplogelasinospora grovesii TaxID=303347 RepID=A0AAN6N874_9PEZI|nr:MFS monocarboxylate transporter-like protein [Diplogelasinospora grovesii]